MNQYEYFEEFKWAVPSAFSSPLAACRFERGDVLYDTRKAYEGPWAESLPHIAYSIQVRSPDRGMPSGEKEDSDLFASNWNQRITFELTDHKAKQTREITTAQGGLYGLLWQGTLDHIEGVLPKIAAPTTAMGLVSSSSLKSADIIDLESLLNRFTGPSPQGAVSNFILSKLSPETKSLLQNYPTGVSPN